MRFFIRTKKFKICVTLIAVLLAVSVCIKLFTNILSPGSSFLGTVFSPVERLISEVNDSFKEYGRKLNAGDELILENKALEDEIDKLRGETAEIDALRRENEFYKNYLEIKEQNPDFKFCPARVIAFDGFDPYKGFTINKGSKDGVTAHCPVIVGNYLLGYTDTVGLTSAKVTTVLSPNLTVGVDDSRTFDPGLITGTADFAVSGATRLYNLSRSCNVAVGDYIVTSGEGVFPSGLLIGTVDNIKLDAYSSSIYASVIPFADFNGLTDVMVITDFASKGTIIK